MNTTTKAGDFDPSFNDGKPLDLEFAGYQRHILSGMAAGRDGLIYVSGARFKGLEFSSSEYFIVALDARGRRWEGFDRDGVAAGSFFKTDQPGVSVRCDTFALHYEHGTTAADDRLYLLGQYTYQKDDGRASTYPAVACYRLDGSPDTAFGTNGICVFAGLEGDGVPSFASPAPEASDILSGESRELPNPDASLRWGVHGGRFYIQGLSSDHRRVLLIVINLLGVIDWTFGINGVQVVERGLRFVPFGLLMDAQGIYLCGRTLTDEVLYLYQATVARLDHRGVPDASYGSNGFKDFAVDALYAELYSLAPLSAGYFVTSGFALSGGSSRRGVEILPLLLSCDDQGGVNPGFNAGAPMFVEGASGRWGAVVVDAHALTALGYGNGAVFVGRFLHDGQLDSSFADGAGWRVLDELLPEMRPQDLMVRPDRSIVFLGWRPFDQGSRSVGVIGALTGQ